MSRNTPHLLFSLYRIPSRKNKPIVCLSNTSIPISYLSVLPVKNVYMCEQGNTDINTEWQRSNDAEKWNVLKSLWFSKTRLVLILCSSGTALAGKASYSLQNTRESSLTDTITLFFYPLTTDTWPTYCGYKSLVFSFAPFVATTSHSPCADPFVF